MSSPTVFVAFDGDGIGRRVGRAVLSDNPEELARISQAIERGEEVLKAWALEHGGWVVEAGGDEATVEVPAEAVATLEALRHKYKTTTEATLSAGVGVRLSQAAKGLMASKLRGKDRVTFYDESVEQEVAAAAAAPPSEAEKIREEYLQKTAYGRSPAMKEAPRMQFGEHSQGEAARAMGEFEPPKTEMTHADRQHGVQMGGWEKQFRQHADTQERADQAHAVRRSGDIDRLKEQVAGALHGVQKQLPILRQLQQAAPDAYQSVVGLTQAVVALGREVVATDDRLAKAERLPKVYRQTGWGTSVMHLPSDNHPTRQQWDASIKQAVADRYAHGKVNQLKEAVIPLDEMHPNNQPANKDRYNLYRRVFRAGDTPHPVVATKEGKGYHLVDGSHRWHAAKDTGRQELRAYVLPGKGLKKMLATAMPAGANEALGMDNFGKDDQLEGGAADRMAPQDFDSEQLAVGIRHELEHTKEAAIAREIAMDHLAQDPNYYRETKEDMEKAVSDIPKGEQVEGPSRGAIHDYNHVLAPEHVKDGYQLRVTHDQAKNFMYAHLYHQGERVGGVHTHLMPSYPEAGHVITPHSELEAPHRGRGLGVAMYEGLYAHARHTGANRVLGGYHSEDAQRVHEALARRHGFKYESQAHEGGRSSYNYALKGELADADIEKYLLEEEVEPHEGSPATEEGGELDKAASTQRKYGHHDPRAHHGLKLPVGTHHQGQVKVRHSDATEGWKSVRAGQVQGQDPLQPLYGHVSHPVSSRAPGAK